MGLFENRRRSQETYRLETKYLHIFTITIEEFQEKRKTDLEDVKVTFLKLQIYQNNNRPGLKSRDRSMERKTREKRQSKKTEKNID